MSCIAPGCTSGYGKEKLPPGVSSHCFPKDPIKRAKWIQAIPRRNWNPLKKAVICSLHFDKEDFKDNRIDSNTSRDLGALKRKCLKEDAIPRKYPGLSKYLSKSRPKERSKTVTSSARVQKQIHSAETAACSFLQADRVLTFQDLLKTDSHEFPSSWNVITLKTSEKLFLDEMSVVRRWVF